MENYVIAELEIVALAAGDTIDVSDPFADFNGEGDDNELPIDKWSLGG